MSDDKARMYEARVKQLETLMHKAHDDLGVMLKRSKQASDRSEKTVQLLKDHAERETDGVRSTLRALAEAIDDVAVESSRLHHRVELRVLDRLDSYKSKSKASLGVLKARESAVKQYEKKAKALETLQMKDQKDAGKISNANRDLSTATTEVMHANAQLNDEMVRFEKTKLSDMDSMITELLHAQVTYHARCLEVLTKAYQEVDIDEQLDLKDILERVKPSHNSLEERLLSKAKGISPAARAGASAAAGNLAAAS